MTLTERDLDDLRARQFESSVTGWRNSRVESFAEWTARMETLDAIVRGDYTVVYPDERAVLDTPYVQNTAQVAMLDMAKLASESAPSVRAEPDNDSDTAYHNSKVREAIADTHWSANKAELYVPYWVMDLAGCGAAFAVVIPGNELGKDYPIIMRVDPRVCLPDVRNGILQDLLILNTMHLREIARLYPQLGEVKPNIADQAEVLDYYSPDEVVRAVAFVKKGQRALKSGAVEIVDRWVPNLPNRALPAAFAQLPSFDSSFRGMFDQIGGQLIAKNRIVKLMLDYTDQVIHSPFEEQGVINPEDPPGPLTMYHLDPNVQNAGMRRVQPAASAPQIFAVLEFLDRESRGGIGYPATRQGENMPSIASASFVVATQGPLTSSVKDLDRLLAFLRQDIHFASLAVDEKFHDVEKFLIRSVDKQRKYLPSKDIKGRYDVKVIYGAGAGLDRLNADVRVLQHQGAGLISRETARNQIDYLTDPAGEPDKIEREAAATALLQKFLAELPPDQLADIYLDMADGRSLAEAVKAFREQQQLVSETAQPQPGQMPGIEGAPPADQAAMAQLALQKGQVPQQQAPELNFPMPPAEQILVANPRQ